MPYTKDMAVEALKASIRASLAAAYSRRLHQGVTLEQMAADTDLTPEKFERALLVLEDDYNLRALGLIAYTLGVRFSFKLVDMLEDNDGAEAQEPT